MKVFKVRKYLNGSPVYPGLSTLSLKLQTPNLLPTTPQISSLLFPTPKLKQPYDINFYTPGSLNWKAKTNQTINRMNSDWNQSTELINNKIKYPSLTSFIPILGDVFSKKINPFKDDSDFGRIMGNLFSLGVSSAGNTMVNNLTKGLSLSEGLGKNTGSSLAGAGAGIVANYIGQGINSLMGDSRLGRSIGQGVATGLGTLGGTALSNLSQTGSFTTNLSKLNINPYSLGMSVVGSALGAATGPSKEYGGKYGGITQNMDMAYDAATLGVNFIPGAGQIISGAMALNKGLSNLFGSTDGMTKTDAILGSAFMPAPIKWLNMWGSSKTGNFNNQSWLNTEKTNAFMGNAFGNLNDKFDKAREEAGKTYGTFSQGAKDRALENINFANYAWDKVLAMADLNELLNIRSLYMSSINNLRYALLIGGVWLPTTRGKEGMKILNNATNHNIGMRLLSGAALIDNKQMILCNVPD